MVIYMIESVYFDGCDCWHNPIEYYSDKDKAEYECLLLQDVEDDRISYNLIPIEVNMDKL